MSLSIIILAAGQGTRMRSSLPKVLHPIGGKPLLQHVLDTAHAFEGAAIHVVIGHGAELVRKQFAGAGVHWVVQAEQLGTGHAVAQVLPQVPDEDSVLVMYGDVPLVRRQTLDALQVIASQDAVGLLTAHLEKPTGYGRILRDVDGNISGIVEEKDAT
jgi:bifunctional UDP-N-acetylglucosamine pyrophosphorylase/glucosamine-1-phosphate N-acetyltransferase